MEENNNVALNEPAEIENSEVESPTIETNDLVDEQVPEIESESTETQEVTEEATHEDRKSAQARIRELNAKKKEAEEAALFEKAKNETLARQIAELTSSLNTPGLGYNPQPTASEHSEDITVEELERRILAKAETLVALNQQKSEFVARVKKEADEVEKLYPQLNPDSEMFDSGLSESISQAGTAFIKANPNASLKKFVDGMMKPYLRSLDIQNGEITKTVSKQVSEKALRPTVSPKAEPDFSELSLRDMEAKLGIVQS